MALTLGATTAPSNITQYFDALFSLSLANYNKTLVDNISASNAFLKMMLDGELYQECDGGTYIAQPLVYALASADSYSGYDELADAPIDGITQAQFEWRQMASPISYNFLELRQNQHKLGDLVDAKMMQTEEGIKEAWANHFFQGSGNAALATPRVSPINGSQSIEPLAKMIHYTPSTSLAIGNINQSTSTWWRNKTKTSAATTLDAFLYEMDNLYNTLALGSGGAPNLIIADQVSYELYVHAWWNRYRQLPGESMTFPFENKKFKNATIVFDDKMHDVESGLVTTGTYGTMYFINTKFFRVRYDPQRNFTMLKDDQGKTFAKPLKGDSRLGHVGWMGNVTINNRRKHGVLGKIARTLTA
jgi:hypothetical protein